MAMGVCITSVRFVDDIVTCGMATRNEGWLRGFIATTRPCDCVDAGFANKLATRKQLLYTAQYAAPPKLRQMPPKLRQMPPKTLQGRI